MAVTLMAVCLVFYGAAQPVVKPLKLSKNLQQKLDHKATTKQTELLSTIIQSGYKYFRDNTGKSIEKKVEKLGDRVAMQQELFETEIAWPGYDDAMIQVDKTLNNNVPSIEQYSLRFIIYPENQIDSAKKLYREIYESINGCIVIAAANKAIFINEPFVPLSAEVGNRYKGIMEFTQFFKETGIKCTIEFTTELNLFYTITISFSKTRFHNKD